MYFLNRFNDSGIIYYYDLIKDDIGYRYLAEYEFNPDTLDWTDHEVKQFHYLIIFN